MAERNPCDERLRGSARAHGRQIGVLVDLQGPKIRIEKFKDGKIIIKDGDKFTLDAECPGDGGDQHRVGLAYKQLPNDLKRGDTMLLDDGRIVLWVENIDGPRIECKVIVGGVLSDRKGINLKVVAYQRMR